MENKKQIWRLSRMELFRDLNSSEDGLTAAQAALDASGGSGQPAASDPASGSADPAGSSADPAASGAALP